jgi:hypothetical protein
VTREAVCCPLSGSGDYDGPSFSVEELRRAAKPHTCCECRDVILPSHTYEHVSGKWDGIMYTYKTCMSCREIRNHFGCDSGWTYTCLWEQLEESFFPSMTAGGPCFEGLSPAAKNTLFEKRMAWLEKYPRSAHPQSLYNPRRRP